MTAPPDDAQPEGARHSVQVASAAALPAAVTFKVPFHDCDPLFVVWHGRYFEYLEVARCALFARHGVDVEDVRTMGFRMYVTEVRCRYLRPLSYNDEVRVTARFTQTTPLLRIAYDVTNLTTGLKAARAVTSLATTDARGQLFTETPDAILERLRNH